MLNTDPFRRAVLSVGNGKGAAAMNYYLDLENLLKTYIRYQVQFKEILNAYTREQLEASTRALTAMEQETNEQKLALIAIEQENNRKEQALISIENELANKDRVIADQERRLANTMAENKSLVSYKLFIDKNETVYVITSRMYAARGEFKIGKCGSLSAKNRLASMNTGHTPNDDLFIAAEYKTNDAKTLESLAHNMMQHYRINDTREWFHLPFLLICKILKSLRDHYGSDQELMNEITMELHNLLCDDPEKIKWYEGVPQMMDLPSSTTLALIEAPPIIEPAVENAPLEILPLVSSPDTITPTQWWTFSITGRTSEQTREFIVGLLGDYKTHIGKKKPSWTNLRTYLIEKFKVCTYAKIESGREQITRLCREHGIILYKRKDKR